MFYLVLLLSDVAGVVSIIERPAVIHYCKQGVPVVGTVRTAGNNTHSVDKLFLSKEVGEGGGVRIDQAAK